MGLFADRRALVYLRRIANAMDIIALHYAKRDNRMWSPDVKFKDVDSKEEPELMHTTDEEMLVQQLRSLERFKGVGLDE